MLRVEVRVGVMCCWLLLLIAVRVTMPAHIRSWYSVQGQKQCFLLVIAMLPQDRLGRHVYARICIRT